MWTSSCLLHATEKKSLISAVYILYNCSLTFPLCLLIKVKENGGEMFQCVLLRQEKLNPSFVYKYRVFQGSRESVVFTGMLLKFIIIFLWSLALSTSAAEDQLCSGVNGHSLVEVTQPQPGDSLVAGDAVCLLGNMESMEACLLHPMWASGQCSLK